MDVLIADDDPAVRNVLTRALGRAGFAVTAVGNGAAALAEVRWHRYDVVVCDIEMPLLDGVRLYEQIEAEQPAAARRVLFVTALADSPEVRALHERTGRPVIQKPFELPELVQVVRRVAQSDDATPERAPAPDNPTPEPVVTKGNRRREERRGRRDRRDGAERRGPQGRRREDEQPQASPRLGGPGPMGLRRSRE